ncbi:MAG TPA: sulfatase [Polyangiales bacterium]|nr:sulfatase [Polyangiales bacterium]
MEGRSSIVCGSVLFLLSTGFTGTGLQRLGPDHGGTPALDPEAALEQACTPARGGRLRLDGDTRGTLPRCATQVHTVRVTGACTLQVGLANLDASETLQFQLAVKRKSGFIDEPARALEPGAHWAELQVALENEPAVQQIRFSVSGAHPQHGVFSRPIVSCPVPDAKQQPWNVLLISLDTLRADRLGVYGNPHELSPNLDRFASQGTTFLQAYAQYPNTYGSHAALFTGMYPGQIGMVGSKSHALPPRQATLASELAARGYVTVAFTEDAYVGSAYGFDRGFDRYHDGAASQEKLQGYGATTFQRATDWLKQRPAQPFFMFLHTYDVHTPYAPSQEARDELAALRGNYSGQVGNEFAGLATIAYNIRRLQYSREDIQHIEWLYDAEVWALDKLVGQLFATLRELGVLDTTLIAIVSDHGEEFSEHGYLAHGETLHEQALRVPLMFRAPGIVPEGVHVHTPVGLLDVPATIADLLGLRAFLPNTIGRSHAAWMRAEPPLPARPVWSELSETATICPEPRDHGFGTCAYEGVSLRDRDYTYIHVQAKNQELLYDRRADPGEARDIAAERPEIAAKYRKLVQGFKQSLGKRSPRSQAQLDITTQSKLRALGYTR